MMTHDTVAAATTHCDEPLNTPPSANPTQPDDPTPPIHLHLTQRIRHLESYSLNSDTFLRHPKLTEQLRTLPDFPLFKRAYFVEPPDQVTNSLYYDQLVRNCYRFFMEDLTAVSEQVKRWLQTVGSQEETPIIDSFEVNPKGWVEYCVISGLRWDFASNPEQAGQWARYLDLHDLFSIDRQKQIRIEDAIPGSPLIALCVKENHSAEGHNSAVFWYNLDTRNRGDITDVLRYR